MPGSVVRWRTLLWCGLLVAGFAAAQEIPDAPQPKIPPSTNKPFPDDAPPAVKNTHPEQPVTTPEAQPDQPAQPQQQAERVLTSRDDLFRIVRRVSFVEIPVTVKDRSGQLVPGLAPNDFTVYEDGVPQELSYFSSDPFPLSVAVVVDTNLPSATMKKVNESLPALIGAFSEFDEVALFRYGNSVQQVSDFGAASTVSTGTIERLKRTGKSGGPPVIGGPLGSQGPMVNNHPVDPGAPQVYTAPQEANVLNDAILQAAQNLSRREKGVRRRILFVISDGREYGSKARYDEVRKFLLAQDISVYALGVDTAAMPVYDKLNRVRLPGFGFGDILPRYASETGGQTFAEFDRHSIEQAYAQITSVARNQYTLGYNTKATVASAYRSIDVHVHRQGLEVTAKAGYYPLPPPPPSH